jgi:hypothetical protein
MNTSLTLADIAGGRFEKSAADSLNISGLLSIAANLKAIHVKTKRYSQHMALDEAFDDLNDSMDKFNECVQGYYIRKKGSRLKLSNPEIKFTLPSDDKVFEAVKQLEDDFKAAAKKVTDDASPLLSLQDDVLNCFYQLYYRLDLN